MSEPPISGDVAPCLGCRHFGEPAWCFHPDLVVVGPIDFVTGQRPLRAVPVITARQGQCGYDAVLREEPEAAAASDDGGMGEEP